MTAAIVRVPPSNSTGLLPRFVEACIFAFYICLVYKLDKLGVLVLIALCGSAIRVKLGRQFLFTPLALLSVLYIAMATVTAFMVSSGEGAYRSVQFVILAVSTSVAAVYLVTITDARRSLLMRRFAVLNAVIFVHMILYHLATGHLTTWKYLADTKSVISVSIIILFYYEDYIKSRFGTVLFFACIAGLALLILLSGERKAYILFAAVFMLSRTPIVLKFWIVIAATLIISVFAAVAPPDSYVGRQINSLISPKPEMQISEFYLIQDIGDQSDIIRAFVNRMAREQFAAHPFMGLGATGYQKWSYAEFGLATDSQGLAMNVHGEVNRVPAEGGIVGIVVAILYVVVLIKAVAWSFFQDRRVTRGSKIRLPLYVLSFLLIYAWVEALDTFMLELILLFGFCAAAKQSELLYRIRTNSVGRKLRSRAKSAGDWVRFPVAGSPHR